MSGITTNDEQINIHAIDAGEDHFLVKKEDLQKFVAKYNILKNTIKQTPKPQDLTAELQKYNQMMTVSIYVFEDGKIKMAGYGIIVNRFMIKTNLIYDVMHKPVKKASITLARIWITEMLSNYSSDDKTFDSDLSELDLEPSISMASFRKTLQKIASLLYYLDNPNLDVKAIYEEHNKDFGLHPCVNEDYQMKYTRKCLEDGSVRIAYGYQL